MSHHPRRHLQSRRNPGPPLLPRPHRLHRPHRLPRLRLQPGRLQPGRLQPDRLHLRKSSSPPLFVLAARPLAA